MNFPADTGPIASPPLAIARLRSHRLSVPVDVPVRNSFRVLTERTALLVEAVDADGVSGWGEIWSNYPPGGARHRQTLLHEVAAPLIEGRSFPAPAVAFAVLEEALRVPGLQCGEPGSFAQVAAGIDLALWDLAARKLGLPLWRWLGGVDTVRVYASGISPQQAGPLAERALAQGFTAMKLKVGFGEDTDMANLRHLRALAGAEARLMVDANQRWTPQQAVTAAKTMAAQQLLWIEEPIPADGPPAVWSALAAQSPLPLAAGENLRGFDSFTSMLESGALAAIQPDPGKWGGFSGGLQVAQKARSAGVMFCPHWLGGGVGLLAALNLLAASGGEGWGEVDINANVLREQFLFEGFAVRNGHLRLGDAPGIGFTPDPRLIERYRAA